MFYKVQLICHHPPHLCRCRHNVATQVTQEDLTANLIKHNPNLLKYLGRTNKLSNYRQQADIKLNENPSQKKGEEQKPYRSIVEEKGLKFILDNKQQPPQKQQPIKQQKKKSEGEQQHKQIIQSPRNGNKQIVSPVKDDRMQSKKQKQLRNHHKELKQQSRYLSNTAFRKYFDRQCFQNYGNQNIHDKADGFVYGNYLKTYNINPHTGQNMPLNQETFYHALVSASPEKYKETHQLKMAQNGQEKNIENHSLQKNKISLQKLREDNLQHSKLQKKYDHLKLKVDKKSEGKPSNIIAAKSTEKNIGQNIQSRANMQSRYSPKQLQIQSKNMIRSPKKFQNSNQISKQILLEEPQSNVYGKPSQSIIQQPSIFKKTSKNVCSHGQRQSEECECCLNQMKGLILSMADSDPDLASRIITSAKKAALYKNFALNNYQNAGMNPHNYRSDGRLNVYEKI